MGTRLVATGIRKVDVLRDQESVLPDRFAEYIEIQSAPEALGCHWVHVMPEREQVRRLSTHVLVNPNPQTVSGSGGRGMSSAADAAAKAIAAATSSRVSVGKDARISSGVAPSARLSSTVRSGTHRRCFGGHPRTSALELFTKASGCSGKNR